MGLFSKKLVPRLTLAICLTVFTTISMLSTLHTTPQISTADVSHESAARARIDQTLDDLTIRLQQNRRKVSTLRDRIDRMTLTRRNFSDEGGGENVHKVGLKRHLLDALQLDQSLVTSDIRGTARSTELVTISETLRNKLITGAGNDGISLRQFGCKDIANSRRGRYVGAGYTKVVEMVVINGTKVALKRPSSGGKDMTHCVESGTPKEACWTLASYKLLKEAALLQQLHHRGIVKLLGICIEQATPTSGRSSDLSLVTELGEPLDLLRLVQTPWEDRLRMILDLMRLLVYLAESPLGPLVIYDFKPTQFVLINGQLKLADLDDLGVRLQTRCSAPDDQCTTGIPPRGRDNMKPPCEPAESCPGYADRLNLAPAWQHFFSLQSVGGPPWLQNDLDRFLNKTRDGEVTSRKALDLLNQLVALYKEGDPRLKDGVRKYSYSLAVDADLPGRHDYWCPNSHSPRTNSCVFSVTNEEEAKHMCSLDDSCRAFILTNQTTWTGRYLVYLKRGYDRPVHTPGCRMFVRIS